MEILCNHFGISAIFSPLVESSNSSSTTLTIVGSDCSNGLFTSPLGGERLQSRNGNIDVVEMSVPVCSDIETGSVKPLADLRTLSYER